MEYTPVEIIDELDLSGGKDSWFDLWHTHLDWGGEGNKNWKLREGYLKALLNLYRLICERLKTYPFPYQIWISIYEDDSSQDAVYIHTKNPNSDNFPLTFSAAKNPIYRNENLKEFIKQAGLNIIAEQSEDGILLSLYDENVGLPIS